MEERRGFGWVDGGLMGPLPLCHSGCLALFVCLSVWLVLFTCLTIYVGDSIYLSVRVSIFLYSSFCASFLSFSILEPFTVPDRSFSVSAARRYTGAHGSVQVLIGFLYITFKIPKDAR